jgi:hypothetical protein
MTNKTHLLVVNAVSYDKEHLLPVTTPESPLATPIELERREVQEIFTKFVEQGIAEIIGERKGQPIYALTDWGRMVASEVRLTEPRELDPSSKGS